MIRGPAEARKSVEADEAGRLPLSLNVRWDTDHNRRLYGSWSL